MWEMLQMRMCCCSRRHVHLEGTSAPMEFTNLRILQRQLLTCAQSILYTGSFFFHFLFFFFFYFFKYCNVTCGWWTIISFLWKAICFMDVFHLKPSRSCFNIRPYHHHLSLKCNLDSLIFGICPYCDSTFCGRYSIHLFNNCFAYSVMFLLELFLTVSHTQRSGFYLQLFHFLFFPLWIKNMFGRWLDVLPTVHVLLLVYITLDHVVVSRLFQISTFISCQLIICLWVHSTCAPTVGSIMVLAMIWLVVLSCCATNPSILSSEELNSSILSFSTWIALYLILLYDLSSPYKTVTDVPVSDMWAWNLTWQCTRLW